MHELFTTLKTEMNRQTETLQISAYNLSICSIMSYYSAGLDQKHHHTPAKIINRVSLFTKDGSHL